jgi:uracil-DNA glycosylase
LRLKSVFIGQMPNSVDDEGDPLTLKYPDSSGSRLAKWMNVTAEEFADRFVRVNLNPHSDDEFSPAHWKASARNMAGLLEHRRVVLLGRAVAEAFDLNPRQYDYFRWFDHPSGYETSLFVVIPHPSGRNRLYNDQQNVNRAMDLLAGLWLFTEEPA